MLAQNFKTAADLGITEQERSALIKTLALMDTGKLRHTGINFDDSARAEHKIFSHEFNMATFSFAHTCGTIACIAGTAELIGGVKFCGRADRPHKLTELFYAGNPSSGNFELEAITVEQAAMALRSYLTTGDARWDLALA